MSTQSENTRSKTFDRANHLLAMFASIMLLFMVLIIAVGVVLRFVFAMPILGLNEVVQLTSVGVVMLALPYCTTMDGHVRVDVLDDLIGTNGRFIGDIGSRLISAFVLGVLVWRSLFKAVDAWKYGDATNMLNLPIWPFYAAIAVGMALCVVVYCMQMLAHILKRQGQ